MASMPIEDFMKRFGPSNEGATGTTGDWDYELAQQLIDDQPFGGQSALIFHMNRIAEGLPLEPVTVDFSPDRVHDGHSRILATWLLAEKTSFGPLTIEYKAVV